MFLETFKANRSILELFLYVSFSLAFSPVSYLDHVRDARGFRSYVIKHEDKSYTFGMMEWEDGGNLGLSGIHLLLIINRNHACLGNCGMRAIHPRARPLGVVATRYQP